MANQADGPTGSDRAAVEPEQRRRKKQGKHSGRRKNRPSVTGSEKAKRQPDAGTLAPSDQTQRQDRGSASSVQDEQQPRQKRQRWKSRRHKGNRNPQAPNATPEAKYEDGPKSEPTLPDAEKPSGGRGQDSTKTFYSDNIKQTGGRGQGRNHRRSGGSGDRDGGASDRRGKARNSQNPHEHNARDKNDRRDRDDRSNDGGRAHSRPNQRPRPHGEERAANNRNDQRHTSQNNRSNTRPARANAPHGKTSNRPVYAALDLGTNNCRLLVAEPHGQSFRVVDAFSRIVRLGEGLSQTGRLSDDAQERAISALKVCQSKLAYRDVKRLRLIATEACRRATNGGAFLHRVYRETGLKLEIVNRETEARLAVSGCASLVDPEAEGVVLFDIGGGSSEIVWLDLDPISEEQALVPGEKRNRQTRRAMRHLSERIRCWTSLQVGVVTLSEKHGGKIVTTEHFEAMVNEVREMLHEFEEREALAEAIQSKHIHMLGTSGTVTTLAGVHLGLVRYDRRMVDGTWLSAHELRSMIKRILEMNFDERVENPCIGQDRADLVLAGCAILEALHREWPVSRLRVADRGLREGILMEMMIDDGVWTPQNKRRGGNNNKARRPRRRGGRGHRGQGNRPRSDSKQD